MSEYTSAEKLGFIIAGGMFQCVYFEEGQPIVPQDWIQHVVQDVIDAGYRKVPEDEELRRKIERMISLYPHNGTLKIGPQVIDMGDAMTRTQFSEWLAGELITFLVEDNKPGQIDAKGD